MAIDATAFRGRKILAIVLYNEFNHSLLISLDYLIDGRAVTIANSVTKMLGDNKELIFSKLRGVISDTEAAQVNADKILISAAKEYSNKQIFLIRCMLHSVANSEKYVMKICNEDFTTLIDNFSSLFSSITSDYSSTNVSSLFKFWLKKGNNKTITLEQKIGNRFHFYSHNCRMLFQNYNLILEFTRETLKG